MQENCLSHVCRMFELLLQKGNNSLTVGRRLAPLVFFCYYLGVSYFELPQTDCSVVQLRVVQGSDALAVTKSPFFIGKSFILVNVMISILKSPIRKETYQSLNAL
jgi:hypothetical protein